jgi:hypothetical protein
MSDPSGDELILRASRVRYARYALGCMTFVGLATLLIRKDHAEGWWLLSIFGASAIVFIIGMLAGENFLRLTSAGFEVRTMFRSHFYRWRDVMGFGVARLNLHKYVTIFMMPETFHQMRGREASATFSNASGMLPDTYGMQAEKLAELLEEWRIRHRLPSATITALRPNKPGPRLPN